jgi:non-ribosomal peptide synthase protein (TIGR01720 family)
VGSYGLIFRSLTEDDTETLLDTAGRLHQVQVIDILLAGVTRGFTAWTGSPSLLVELSSHGRAPLFPDIEVSRTVGWFQAVYPVLLRPSDTPLSSAPVSAMSRMLGEVPSHGVGYGALRYLSPDPDVRHQLECLPRAQVTFNYVGAYHEGALGGGDEDQERSRVSKRQVQAYDYIQVVATVRKRQLRLRFRYHENVYRRETIERVAEDVRDTVRALITALQSSGSTGSPETTVPIPIDRESR